MHSGFVLEWPMSGIRLSLIQFNVIGIFECIGDSIMALVDMIAGCLECIISGESAVSES